MAFAPPKFRENTTQARAARSTRPTPESFQHAVQSQTSNTDLHPSRIRPSPSTSQPPDITSPALAPRRSTRPLPPSPGAVPTPPMISPASASYGRPSPNPGSPSLVTGPNARIRSSSSPTPAVEPTSAPAKQSTTPTQCIVHKPFSPSSVSTAPITTLTHTRPRSSSLRRSMSTSSHLKRPSASSSSTNIKPSTKSSKTTWSPSKSSSPSPASKSSTSPAKSSISPTTSTPSNSPSISSKVSSPHESPPVPSLPSTSMPSSPLAPHRIKALPATPAMNRSPNAPPPSANLLSSAQSSPRPGSSGGGNLSDGNTALPVDMKRLLSKPAVVTGSSALNGTSDSEGGYSGYGGYAGRSRTAVRERVRVASDSDGAKSAPSPRDWERDRQRQQRLLEEQKERDRALAMAMERERERQRQLAREWDKERELQEEKDELTIRMPLPADSGPLSVGLSVVFDSESSLAGGSGPNTSRESSRRGSRERKQEASGDGKKDRTKKPRNVLKRRATKTATNVATPAIVQTSRTTTDIHRESLPHSLPVLNIDPSITIKLPPREPFVEAGYRNPSPIPKGGGSWSGNGSSPSSGALTPAGAVVQAYKQQAARKEDFGSIYGGSEDSLSIAFQANEGLSDSEPDRERGRVGQWEGKGKEQKGGGRSGDATPYYTVFGSTSGRVVAIGGPQDAWSTDVDVSPAGRARSGKGLRLGKTLTRKVSGRWRKSSGSVERKGDFPDPKGRRPSLQERRSDGRTEKGGATEGDIGERLHTKRSLRLSLDKFSDSPMEIPMVMQMPRAMHGSLSEPSTISRSRSIGTGTAAGEEPAFMNEPASVEGGLGGGKLWKLMKRISTGALKDKYQDASQVPLPPVPVLPTEYLIRAGPRTNDGYGDTHQTGMLSRFMQSRSSMSAAPASVGNSRAALPLTRRGTTTAKMGTVNGTGSNGASSAPRPSTNTRSSSPVSSDVASSQFFNRTHSTRSSTSSYGDQIPPPVPNTHIGQHIIPPSELYRLNGDSEEKVASLGATTKLRLSLQHHQEQQRHAMPPPDDWIIRSPAEERPSLPFPPRRGPKSTSESRERSPSPTIPSFSTVAAINTFPTRKSSLAPAEASVQSATLTPHAVSAVSSAPPRPSRSTRRPGPASAVSGSANLTAFPSHGSEDYERQLSLHAHHRLSSGDHSSASTARPRRRSTSLTSPHTALSTTLTFRELGSTTEKHVLTEQEKADKWADLLERSARAGGTLHLGSMDLLSDQLRFSKLSEMN